MKFKTLIFTTFLLFGYSLLFSDTLTVAKDGTGNFEYIMDAIVVVNNGDVIIVYPGTYYENINFIGRNFTLASTYIINPIDSLINKTIIDGGAAGSCIRLVSNEQNCRIVGFTLQNGSGSQVNNGSYNGGGIYFRNCTATLEKCIIKNNTALSGAGLMIWDADIHLVANTIKNNLANLFGGGIYIEIGCNVVFDSIMLNNIYLNYSQLGTDICKYFESVTNHIALDTATVKNLTHYYIDAINSNMFPVPGNVTFEANHGKVEQVQSDVYVNPSGNNNNSGLSPDEPLKTIAFALAKIVSDSINNNTIHLSPGTYSPSATGEKYPLCLKSNVPIIGAGIEASILDVEYMINMGRIGRDEKELTLKNLAIVKANGHNMPFKFGALWADDINKLVLDNLHFYNNRSYHQTCTTINEIDSVFINNCIFDNNRGMAHVNVFNSFRKKDTYFLLESNIIQNNIPDSTRDESCAVCTIGLEYLLYGNGRIHGNIINCLIANNHNYVISPLPTSSGISINRNANTSIINSTIGNNNLLNQDGAAIGISTNSNANLYNCIVYGNNPSQLFLWDDHDYTLADTLYVYNSCIEDGDLGIFDYGQYNFVYYDETTNISKDPEWLAQGDYPYAISFNSGCINSGTLDLPDDIELPEFDLAGNPRIWGSTIDMGAYEWYPVDVEESSTCKNNNKQLLSAFPNPMINSSSILVKCNNEEQIKLEVYNNTGVRVKVLLDTNIKNTLSKIRWDGSDYNNKKLPSGIYYVVMSIDGKEVESLKIIKQ